MYHYYPVRPCSSSIVNIIVDGNYCLCSGVERHVTSRTVRYTYLSLRFLHTPHTTPHRSTRSMSIYCSTTINANTHTHTQSRAFKKRGNNETTEEVWSLSYQFVYCISLLRLAGIAKREGCDRI